jgi:hypothetical protein
LIGWGETPHPRSVNPPQNFLYLFARAIRKNVLHLPPCLFREHMLNNPLGMSISVGFITQSSGTSAIFNVTFFRSRTFFLGQFGFLRSLSPVVLLLVGVGHMHGLVYNFLLCCFSTAGSVTNP